MQNTTTLFFLLLSTLASIHPAYSINSYIFIPEKTVQEELPVGSLIIDLAEELRNHLRLNEDTRQQFIRKDSNAIDSDDFDLSNEQFTFLEDLKSQSGTNKYFLLDSVTGRITTKRFIDRESMCLNRHCSELCELNTGNSELVRNSRAQNRTSHKHKNNCKMNVKVLLMPSSKIISLDVVIEDINDNKPQFRKESMQASIAENVPIGYRIPIEMAYDPDIGKNTIQRYDIIKLNTELDVIKSTFELVQNLNEFQLALVVKKPLDRELESEYSLSIVAYDGGIPSFSGKIDVFIKILDVNDNNPIFEKSSYKFYVNENTPIGTLIGIVNASDADEGVNAQIRYSLVGSYQQNASHMGQVGSGNAASYFALDAETGQLKLKQNLDYEDEIYFSLTAEARDFGVGSLPSYANVEIFVLDNNDNLPEISVSFLNSIRRQMVDGKLVIYLNENCDANKFISHVSITDKDSGDNGQVKWYLLVNGKKIDADEVAIDDEKDVESLLFKISPLNSASFILNTGTLAPKLYDRETIAEINVSIVAYDLGWPGSNLATYNFTIQLQDENDNEPKFESNFFNLTIYENNLPNEIVNIFRVIDADLGENSRVSFDIVANNSIYSPMRIKDIFSIDANGILRAKMSFDAEQHQQFRFSINATDNGESVKLSSKCDVQVNIVDRNDNSPQLGFKIEPQYNYSWFPENRSLSVNVDESLQTQILIAKFNYSDADVDFENTYSHFEMVAVNATSGEIFDGAKMKARSPFRLTQTGNLYISRKLTNKNFRSQSIFFFRVFCVNSFDKLFNSSVNLTVTVKREVVKNFDEASNELVSEEYVFSEELEPFSENLIEAKSANAENRVVGDSYEYLLSTYRMELSKNVRFFYSEQFSGFINNYMLALIMIMIIVVITVVFILIMIVYLYRKCNQTKPIEDEAAEKAALKNGPFLNVKRFKKKKKLFDCFDGGDSNVDKQDLLLGDSSNSSNSNRSSSSSSGSSTTGSTANNNDGNTHRLSLSLESTNSEQTQSYADSCASTLLVKESKQLFEPEVVKKDCLKIVESRETLDRITRMKYANINNTVCASTFMHLRKDLNGLPSPAHSYSLCSPAKVVSRGSLSNDEEESHISYLNYEYNQRLANSIRSVCRSSSCKSSQV